MELRIKTDEAGPKVVKVYDEGGAPVGYGVRRGTTAPFFPQRPAYEWRAGKRSGAKLPGGLWVQEGGVWVEFGKWHADRGGNAEVLLKKYQRRTALEVRQKESGDMRGDPKKSQTFRLSASATKALDILAWEYRLSKTEVLEKLLVGEITVKAKDSGMTLIEAVVEDEVIAEAYRQGGAVREAIERAWRMASHA